MINVKKLISTALVAALGAALPTLVHDLSAAVPVLGPLLSALALAVSHYVNAPGTTAQVVAAETAKGNVIPIDTEAVK